MSLGWQFKRIAVFAASLFVALAISTLVYYLANSTSDVDDVQAAVEQQTIPAGGLNSDRASLTWEQVELVGQVDLQRMKPLVLPPVELPPEIISVPEPTPLRTEAILVGTVIDADAKYSYAILRWPSSEIRLVKMNEAIDENQPELRLRKVNRDSILLKDSVSQEELVLEVTP